MMTEQEFYCQVVSFREKMGRIDLDGEQYRNLFKMLAIYYLNTDTSDRVVDIFTNTSVEYARRMFLMGHGHLI